VRTPSVNVVGVESDSSAPPLVIPTAGVATSKWILKVQVDNPNFFPLKAKMVTARGYSDNYASGTVPIAEGNITNLDIPKKTNEVIDFPITITYDTSKDPGFTFLQSLLTNCGILPGSTKQKITINYEVDLSFTLLARAGVVPTIRNAVNISITIFILLLFLCPFRLFFPLMWYNIILLLCSIY